ncbi:hypothetical protein DFH07DRAFT_948556 [Mycena maculata]|uniref:Uncharacterized protein n=1 Tax=Mycena maculata TaxID=230809 RepID=A0AAD7P112_9AGAR|nr:hypothetical protein DFH07DRAFT_948556 [Mycena maculata]
MHAASLTAFCVLALLTPCSRAIPIPREKPAAANAMTGFTISPGGNAQGGSVDTSGSASLFNVLSNNAGNGGGANSGPAIAADTSRTNSPGGNSLVNVITNLDGATGSTLV